MTTTLELNTESLINSIMEYVPQVPFVVEQIGQAINIAKANYTEAQLDNILAQTIEVAKFAKEESTSKEFFKYHLVVISLLQDITDMKKLKMFETQSNKVINGIKALQPNEEEIAKRGFVRATSIQLVNLFKQDAELFALTLIEMNTMLNNMLVSYEKTGVLTNEEHIMLLQLAMIEQTIRMNNLSMSMSVSAFANQMLVTLKKFNI